MEHLASQLEIIARLGAAKYLAALRGDDFDTQIIEFERVVLPASFR